MSIRTADAGALELLLAQDAGDSIDVYYDAEQGCFVASLVETVELDEYEPGVEWEDGMFTSSELVSASGQTIAEAVLQLELAYRNFLGVEEK